MEKKKEKEFKTDAKSISGQRYPAFMKKYMTEFLYVEVVIMVDGAVAPMGPMTYGPRIENFLDINSWI